MLVFLIGYSFSAKGLRTRGVRDRPAQQRRRARRRAAAARRRAAGSAPSDRSRWPLALVALPLLFDNVTSRITFDQFWIGVFAQGIALAVIYLSYTLVTGEGGLISLCQITLAGIGAFAAARLAAEAGWPVWLAILVGALFAVPFGLLVALPEPPHR